MSQQVQLVARTQVFGGVCQHWRTPVEVIMANVEKHVKSPIEQAADAGCSLVPTHSCGARLVDRYLNGRRVDQQSTCSTVTSAVPPFVLRLEGVPTTPVTLARIRKRVEELNRQLRQSEVPFRLRMM